ncbi:MAG TPA: hypothetical protein PK055_00450 [Gammaproteobacteria bacterium]|nr:hypothetical protein [Gammaproteobacteria bacterium]HPI94657.1 hypothetical protein [Gammaproteobacteria bacterium]HPQ86102.1 hypothetical protein [Gammaproteobacteria bacterium]
MKLFIPTNEINNDWVDKGFSFKPLIIEAYQFHISSSIGEKTQNLLSKKVKTGTITTNIGKTLEE